MEGKIIYRLYPDGNNWHKYKDITINNKFILWIIKLFIDKKKLNEIEKQIDIINNFEHFKKYEVKNKRFEEGLFVDKDIIIDPKLTKFKDVNYKGIFKQSNLFRPGCTITQIID